MGCVLIKLPVNLTIRGPVLTAGFTYAYWGVDITFYRDWKHRLALPASLVRGKLREAMLMAKDENHVSNWFGNASKDDEDKISSYIPKYGRIKVNDFIHEKTDNDKGNYQTRIRIEPQTGIADRGGLYIKEAPFPSGQETLWKGSVEFFAKENKENALLDEIKQAFLFITSIGAEKTIGFGQMLKVEFAEAVFKRETQRTLALITHCNGMKLAIKPLEPFLIGGIRKSENIISSENIIPGSVLKGALAVGLNRISGSENITKKIDKNRNGLKNDYDLLAKHFSKIRFLHAKPSLCKYKRSKTIPLSGVTYGGKYKDIAFEDSRDIYAEATNPVTFQIDWKKSVKNLPPEYEMPAPEYHPVTRTAIEKEARIADEGNLYSWYMLKPKVKIKHTSNMQKSQQVYWNSEIIIPEFVEKEKKELLLKQINKALQKALNYIGKRQSAIDIETEPLTKNRADMEKINQQFAIVLQTSSIMLDPQDLAKHSDEKSIFDENQILKKLYRDYWDHVFNGSVSMKNFFATQELQGGYLGMRFFKNHYHPFYLTSQGSTFVFSISDVADENEKSTINKIINKLTTKGLDLPTWAKKYYGENPWQLCPFVPENGYGEIRIQRPDKENKKWVDISREGNSKTGIKLPAN